ncbi:diguanylate cyclase (GGDEF)-like protein [Bacillus pakistanensis]|uniref:Diguanylate cyclase (GGDEF)-like protein n=1 Tax=Rossellomorea pakistanensis TaxID=992288 RepID=A0ABS2NAH2_9BACI|nr:sensor domain-containing diguanylate cyclase [Bacillus pakistanensis]MBM7584848.1 diguanylate cyclase (GGDEF)-like protein [Bacillus pakistanensis]
MDVGTNQKKFIWILWAFIVPPGLYLTYHFFPPQIENIWGVISLFVMTACASFMPIVINSTPMVMIQWVTLAAFLQYGLFFEVLLMQFSVVLLLVKLRINKNEMYRIPLNSSMFFLVSILSGLLYFGIGGEIGPQPLEELVGPAIVYQVMNIILNQVILIVFFRFLDRKIKLLGEDLVWDFLSIMLMFPLGVTWFYLSLELGAVSLFLLGIPFISVATLLRLYNSSEKINQYLQKAVEIGHQLTENLNVKEVLDLFLDRITSTLPVEYAYILDVKDDKLILIRRVEKGELKNNDISPLKRNEDISGGVWASGKSIIFRNKTEWDSLVGGYMPEDAESVICVPIVRSQMVRGVLLLASSKKNAFEKYQLMIVDILCSYLGVAIANARHYETTKWDSERCALTKLYNYRYFEIELEAVIAGLHSGEYECISLIMLDIDRFKSINDTYGHQSGNEILCVLAQKLEKLIDLRGTVARYGGEEFVILLKDIKKGEALKLAEDIRIHIESHSFLLHSDLEKERKQLSVNITASLGVATAPYEADDGLSLIRQADRALYTGAKQAGRNRVAQYVK